MSMISDISKWAPAEVLDPKLKVQESSSSSLDFNDYLQLMVAMFQNQDPENAASTTDMMNMLVQMTSVQAINNITDATTMLYTSSLVGKEVTVGTYTNKGLEEISGIVTGTGTYGGKPVVFVDDVSYYLSDIMAVGKLPPLQAESSDPVEGEDNAPIDPEQDTADAPPPEEQEAPQEP